MLKLVDYYLDRVTMYRLVLYVLIFFISIASIFSFFGVLKISYIAIVFSSIFLVSVCFLTNKIFSKLLNIPANVESVYITALILALIITPAVNISDLPFLLIAGVLSMASKYILAINRRHIFNPAAISVTLIGIALGGYASWWVGTFYMAPFVLILGFLVVRKIRREDMVLSFLSVSIIASLIYTFTNGGSDFIQGLQNILFNTPLLFFAFIMLTEPLTSPTTQKHQIVYAVLAGILIAPQFSIAGYYFTPEAALIAANFYSYIFNPNYKFFLNLISKNKLSKDTYEFNFPKAESFNFMPGQYMQWTLPHQNTDSRGNRRYFSLSSSPTEDRISMTVKFSENSSSFKKELLNIQNKNKIIAAQVAGDFTMSRDFNKPMVFIAGGVGITPFRSMIKYILDKNIKSDIVLIYSNKTEDEILFKNIFEEARKNGVKIFYVLTDEEKLSKNWKGLKGHVQAETIKKEIPDYKSRVFYVSGPQLMVQSFEDLLKSIGIKKSHIKTDFFPGYTGS